jgi:hypothetical protein
MRSAAYIGLGIALGMVGSQALELTTARAGTPRTGPVELPHRFQNGQVADANQVNANFDTLAREVGDIRFALEQLLGELSQSGFPQRMGELFQQVQALEDQVNGHEARLAGGEDILQFFSLGTIATGRGAELAPTLRVTGVNLQIVNGLGSTNGNPENPLTVEGGFINGTGNLIIGYAEPVSLLDPEGTIEPLRAGSHNLILGMAHRWGGFASIVAGRGNAIGAEASALGGFNNRAVGPGSVISGGADNATVGIWSSVSGGVERTASGESDWRAGELFQDE